MSHQEGETIVGGVRSPGLLPRLNGHKSGAVGFLANIGEVEYNGITRLQAEVVLFRGAPCGGALQRSEGPRQALQYPGMFTGADVVLLNKVDLLPHFDYGILPPGPGDAPLGHPLSSSPAAAARE